MPQRRHPPGFLLAACAAVCGVSLTLGTVGPLLPRFSAEMHSGLYTGLVIAGHPIGSLLAALPTLLASRRFGLPRVIAAGAVVAFAASALFVWPGSGWWIVLTRVGYGASGTIVWQSVFAWAITNTGPGRRGRTTAMLLIAATGGSLLAPQLGALADRFGLWLCAVPPLLLLGASSRFAFLPRYEMLARPDVRRVRSAFGSRDGLVGVALIAGGALVQLAVGVTLPLALHAHGVGAFGIGAVLTFAAAALMGVNPAAGRLVDHGHTRGVLVAGFGLLTLALLGLAVAPSAAVALPLAFAATSLTGIAGFVGGVLASRAVAGAEVDQTVSQTVATLGWAPAAIVGSVGAGALAAPEATLLALAAATAVAAVVAAGELAHHRSPVPA